MGPQVEIDCASNVQLQAKQTLARALMSAFRIPEAIETYKQARLLQNCSFQSECLSVAFLGLVVPFVQETGVVPSPKHPWTNTSWSLRSALTPTSSSSKTPCTQEISYYASGEHLTPSYAPHENISKPFSMWNLLVAL